MARDHPSRPSPFLHLFRTKRLIFRALENTPEHAAFLRDLLLDDTQAYAQCTDRLLVPPSLDNTETDIAELLKSLLAVLICIRPADDDGSRSPDGDDNHSTAAHCVTKEAPLTAIGWLTLDSHALTLHHRSCRLGIVIAAPYQGVGYGTEAIDWALEWAFRVAGMHAVRLSCWSFNERALRLYARLGFVREGVAREAYYYDFQWYDRVSFSMLDREWAAKRCIGGVGK